MEFGIDPFRIAQEWTPRQLAMAIDCIQYRGAVERWAAKNAEKNAPRIGSGKAQPSSKGTHRVSLLDAFEEADKAGLSKPYPWRWKVNDDGTREKVRVH